VINHWLQYKTVVVQGRRIYYITIKIGFAQILTLILHLQISYLLVTANFYSFYVISQHKFEDLKELDQLGHLQLYEETMLNCNQRNGKEVFEVKSHRPD